MTHRHPHTCGSTNDEAVRLAGEHVGEAVLVSADEQTAGRGRSGRAWRSPRGGAWFSIAWPVPDDAPAERYAAAPLLVGLAVLQAIEEWLPRPPAAPHSRAARVVTPDEMVGCCTRGRGKGAQRRAASDESARAAERLQLKWPNDVLLTGKKVAGVLCERVELRPGKADPKPLLVIGVGINANLDPSELGDDLRYPATTLRAAIGKDVDLPRLIRRCADRIDGSMRGLDTLGLTAPAVRTIESHLAWLHCPVRFDHGGREVEGVLHGLDERGRLVLDHDGKHTSYDSGEIATLTR